MRECNDLCWHFLMFMHYLISSEQNAVLVVSFSLKKRHFEWSVKQWMVLAIMTSKQEYLLQKSSKLH